MACTVVITRVSSSVVANQPCKFTLTITNNGASAVTISSLGVSEESKTGARIGQPNFLTTNASVGVAVPTIDAAASLSLPFTVVPNVPAMSGPSPQNVGGAAPRAASPAGNSSMILRVTGMDSDSLVFSSTIQVPVLSTAAVFPRPEGGALDLRQGANIMSLALMGAL